jgi:hypothetical protein
VEILQIQRLAIAVVPRYADLVAHDALWLVEEQILFESFLYGLIGLVDHRCVHLIRVLDQWDLVRHGLTGARHTSTQNLQRETRITHTTTLWLSIPSLRSTDELSTNKLQIRVHIEIPTEIRVVVRTTSLAVMYACIWTACVHLIYGHA